MRIDKYLSNLKFGSRNEIKSLVKAGLVTVNHKLINDSSVHVNLEHDIICVDQNEIIYHENLYIKIYKPAGYVSANKDLNYPCITDLIEEPYDKYDLKIAGRLDLDSEGLMILTTDGAFAHEITHPKKHLHKIYEVILDKPFAHEEKLLEGLNIKDGKNNEYFAKAIHIVKSDTHVKITIDEGKFHQVKRMFLAVGYEVIFLKRVQIGKLLLGDLKPETYALFKKEDIYD